MVDDTRDPLDDDIDETDLDFVDPDSILDVLSETQLDDLRKDIETFEKLEKSRANRDYWRTMQIICKDKRTKLRALGPEGRAMSSVSSDIDKLLGPKTLEELERSKHRSGPSSTRTSRQTLTIGSSYSTACSCGRRKQNSRKCIRQCWTRD